MENDILFSETQKFKQWWIWLILLGINGQSFYAIYIQVIKEQPYGNNPMSDMGLFISAGLMLLLTVLFFTFRLETKIENDGIYVKFFPFHLSYKHYGWNKISKSYVRKYNPILEYGGWGFRLGIFGKGRAFNVSGNQGLQLEFNDRKKLLIGTNKPVELTETLIKIGHLKPEQ